MSQLPPLDLLPEGPEAPAKHIPASLNSLTFLEDSTSTTNTSTSLQQSLSMPNQEQATPLLPSSNTFSTKTEIVRSKRKASTACPSLLNFDDIYERIDKFLDDEGINITSPSTSLPKKQATILKPTMKLDSLNLVKFNSSPIPLIPDLECQSAGIPSIGTPGFGTPAGNVAMPSFLAKRSMLQRSQSGKFAVAHSPVEVSKRSASDDLTFKPEKSSRFARFYFSEASTSHEESEDPSSTPQ